MKHLVDIESWERRDNYNFFRPFLNSWFSITTEIDCTEAFAAAKTSGRSFFLYYLYAMLRSANEIREFRYRDDAQGNVVLHDTVDIVTPIAVPGRTFFTVRIPYCADFERFYAEAHTLVTNIPADGDPYGEGKKIQVQGDYDVLHLSAVPGLWFSSINYTIAADGHPADYPMSTVGKATLRDGRLKMPFSIYANHAFIDGAHLTQLFAKFEEYLRQIAQQ